MAKVYIYFVWAFIFYCAAQTIFAEESNAIILSVECKSIRLGGDNAKINTAFEDSHEKWMLKCPGSSSTKLSESSTGAQWRIQILKNNHAEMSVVFRDKYGQQYSMNGEISAKNSEMAIVIKKRFNTVKIDANASVYFAKSGKSKELSDKEKCVSWGNGLYDFPAVWQGQQRGWSVYIKTGSNIKEINASGNFYGIWGTFQYQEQSGTPALIPVGKTQKLGAN